MVPFAALRMRNAGSAGVDNAASAPTFGAVGAHAANSLTAAYPAGISAGDFLEVTVYCRGGSVSPGGTSFSLAGWSSGPTVEISDGTSIQVRYATFWKIATGSESGSVTPTLTGTGAGANCALMKRYSGVNPTSPYEATTTNWTADVSGVGASSAAATTLGTGRLVINQWLYSPTATTTINTGSGWTQDYAFERFGIGPDYQVYQSHKTATGFGAQSAESMTTAGTGFFCGALSYALKGVP